jgi:hypothetical protein
MPLAIAIVQEGGEASPVGRPDFKSEKGPLAGPWWVRLPLSSAKTLFVGDRRPSKNSVIAVVFQAAKANADANALTPMPMLA